MNTVVRVPEYADAQARPKGGFFGHHITRPEGSPALRPREQWWEAAWLYEVGGP